MVPTRDAPGVLPDVESSWDAVAVAAVPRYTRRRLAVAAGDRRGRPPRDPRDPRRRPTGAPYAAHTDQVRLDESYIGPPKVNIGPPNVKTED